MDRQYVGIDFHRQRSVIVRLDSAGERLAVVRIDNNAAALAAAMADAGDAPEVVIEATLAGIGRSTCSKNSARQCISPTRRRSTGANVE